MGNNYYISPPVGTSQAEFDAAVIASGTNYALPAPYQLSGPNSNTAAAGIIAGAGGIAPDVPRALGEFWHPVDNIPIPY
jgi:hypothetical protein